MSTSLPSPQQWYDKLTQRHLESLTFQEVRRAVQAVSKIYVQNRHKLSQGAVLNGAGKRAAFALFYGPIHLLFIKQLIEALSIPANAAKEILDFGCGTGIGGAAWALATESTPRIQGVDLNAWAISEAKWTYDYFGLRCTTTKGDAVASLKKNSWDVMIAAYAMNELPEKSRESALRHLLKRADEGKGILIIEPIAKKPLPYWTQWATEFTKRGGQSDEWAFNLEMPPQLALLDKASGLRHHRMKGRSLWLPPKNL